MAELKNWYLICYGPKRWRKAYKLLEGYGERIQYSVFRCWLSQRMREKLLLEMLAKTQKPFCMSTLENRKIISSLENNYFLLRKHRCL
jgi:CRISPR-associated endonuclease Cas2